MYEAMDNQRGNPWAGFAGRAVIAPSLLACDFSQVGREIDRVISAGADVLHLDIMDGHFVTNLSMGPPVVESIRKYTDAVLDVHIMVSDPEYYIERFADAGADSITFHIEATDDPAALVARLGELGLGAGVSLRPGTGAEALSEVIDAVDLVLVMTVEPGYGGQAFRDDMLEKIVAIRGMLRPDQRLEVDGGIDAETIARCAHAGADVFVAGSNIFGADDAGEAIDALKQSVSGNRGTN
jgi:ribulose-phosphate 3-epimerase